MQIKIQQFMDDVLDEKITAKVVKTDLATMQQVDTVKMGLDFIAKTTSNNEIAQYNWVVDMSEGEKVSIRIETSVINLPLEDTKTISKILNVEDEAEMNVYLIAETPDMNKSGLRIDKVASVMAVQDDIEGVSHSASNWVNDQLAAIVEIRQNKDTEE
ncbi:hypothetical protein FC70_GL000983 [Paucilactobacillus oligofermentans DSM 15707 = LMG 22743]|uniref:Uncharacterized protein n=1 Tax=Paucilactobacillus oligofermentans DSM 15707 = LMG 22743 TaxID=1423778 RepID=A0A0R1RPT0_9LACO|nr:hypothetical protein [Paucilactobacillus oligofermentans]KRL55387.1 hypothetical protein FC70_GL000983 [Paucilactobacillus oligofermentans DSM 15707 = LMG 22743]CUS25623.1 Uncharacterized protein LACOL_0315 [Paucilactobacillus oligofermentans DSM 15707 = LMG 22743]